MPGTMEIATTLSRNKMLAKIRDSVILPEVIEYYGLNNPDNMPHLTGMQLPIKTKSKLRRVLEHKGDEEFLEDLRQEIIKTSALGHYIADLIKQAEDSGILVDVPELEDEEVVDEQPVVEPIVSEKDKKYNEGYWAKEYQSTGDLDAKDKALQSLKPLIMKQVANVNVSKSISHGALYGKGVGLASHAIDTWDPKQSKLSTHVVNQLKKLHRYVNKYGPMLHTPEHRISQWSDLDKAFEAYEHEHGTGEYNKDILAESTGLPVADIEKAIAERRKVFNDSSINTTNIPWKDRYMGLDLDLLSKEFEGDKVKKKVFAAIRKVLAKGEEGNVKVTDIARITGLPYRTANSATKEIVHTIKNGLSFE